MDINIKKHDLERVFTLEGTLKEFSTEKLHYHEYHQFLRIRSGITLLEEKEKKQPLFSNMTAFIPAGIPHRSTVIGDLVQYKSIYLESILFPIEQEDIVIFDMSELGVALFNRIEIGPETDRITLKSLDLLLNLINSEISNISNITRIPIPDNPDNKKIVGFIEENFHKKLTLSDFAFVVNYSPRHISRIFKSDLKISIFEYIKLYRIFRATIDLCGNRPDTTTNIAFSCGYDSLSSFYKDFKDVFLMSPKEFKRNNK